LASILEAASKTTIPRLNRTHFYLSSYFLSLNSLKNTFFSFIKVIQVNKWSEKSNHFSNNFNILDAYFVAEHQPKISWVIALKKNTLFCW
jgi:hypothetical protein